jgi:hypothetical protein
MFRGENAPETGLSRFPPVIEKIPEKLARYASNACKSRLSKLSGRFAPELKYARDCPRTGFLWTDVIK